MMKRTVVLVQRDSVFYARIMDDYLDRREALPPYELRAKSREMALLEVRKWGPDKIVDGQWNRVWTPVMLVNGEVTR